MSSGPTSLYDVADELLQTAKASLGASGADLTTFVSIGDPPYDGCELLTVHVAQLHIAEGMRSSAPAQGGLTPLQQQRYGIVNIVQMEITILRCIATAKGGAQISVPAAAKMNSEAARGYEDAWRIWNGLRSRLQSQELFAGFPCRSVDIGPALPISPAGGGAGWAIGVQVALDGYTQA